MDRLGLNFDQVFRFVLDSDLVVRKLRLADQESIPDEPMDDPLAKHDADFVMLGACVNQLMQGLEKAWAVILISTRDEQVFPVGGVPG